MRSSRELDVVDRPNGYNRLLYARGPSRELPYVLRPNLSVTLFGAPVHVNRMGLRDREIDVAPKPGVHRALMLGDSVLFGTVLRAEERVSVAIFPEGYQIGIPDPDLAPQRVVLAACAAIGIRCLDLHPAFAAAGGDLFLDTQHPNARGHAVAAGEIARALLEPDATDRERRA